MENWAGTEFKFGWKNLYELRIKGFLAFRVEKYGFIRIFADIR